MVDLVDHLGIGHVAMHRHLKAMIASGLLIKIGSAPKVVYRLVSKGPTGS